MIGERKEKKLRNKTTLTTASKDIVIGYCMKQTSYSILKRRNTIY
jgi:hypothetical protein